MDKIKTPVRDGKDTSILDANGKQIAFAVFAEMAEIVDALNTAADRDKYRDACERLTAVVTEIGALGCETLDNACESFSRKYWCGGCIANDFAWRTMPEPAKIRE